MKAAIFESFGPPSEVLTCGEADKPEPGKGEVRIKTGLASIHNHDLILVEGNYGYRPELPAIGGSEAMGVVDALGEGVSGFEVGQRIATSFTQGTWAQYFTVKADYIVPLPDAISDETAAQMLAMPLSALFAIDALGAEKGDWILQSAATGAVAKVVAMVGKARGIGVINLVRRQSAIDELNELGITNAVSTEEEDWADRVHEILDGKKIKGVIDGVGGKLAGQMLHLIGDQGVFLSFGAMAGEPLELSPNDLILKQSEVKGFWLGKMLETMPPARLHGFIKELVGLLADGTVTLQTGETFPLDQVADAATAAREKGKGGKILLKA